MAKERRREEKLKGGETEGETDKTDDERVRVRESVTEKWVYINPDLLL